MGEPPPDHSAPDPADPQSFGAIAQPAAAGEQPVAEPAKRPRVHPAIELVLVNRFMYHFHPPRRGDIIVFHPPGRGDTPIKGAKTEASVNYIKRVIGLPGETIEMRHGTVLVRAPNAPWHALHESYIASNSPKTGPGSRFGPDVVPKGDYFVLGDNRGNSDDSRIWGPLPRRNIIGKAFLIYWPLNRITTL